MPDEVLTRTMMEKEISVWANKFSTNRVMSFSTNSMIPPEFSIWDESPSSSIEMDNDWKKACIFYVNKIMERNYMLSNIDPDCYFQIEDIWLDDIKKFRAFHFHLRNPLNTEAQNYYEICNFINKEIYHFSPGKHQGRFVYELSDSNNEDDFVYDRKAEFKKVQDYFFQKYLNKSNKKINWKNTSTKKLLSVKSSKLNKTSAKACIELYYNNIVKAVLNDDNDAINNVMEALNKYTTIINCLEAKTAILCLNKKILQNNG